MSRELADQEHRQRALEPTHSFIVQAPAGSGKTGLLVRRFLTLLARVEQPEEILAITFTRKATAEMQERIVGALTKADDADQAQQLDAEILALAKQALVQDRACGWNLADNPGRLQIKTIDALCYELVRYMPWSARFGASPNLLDTHQIEHLYLEAATRTLDQIEDGPPWADHCANLLRLVKADFNQARSLIATMLAKRDYWIRGLNLNSQQQMEQMRLQVMDQHLQQICSAIPDWLKPELVTFGHFAASRLTEKKTDRPLCACLDMTSFPQAKSSHIDQWRGIADLLLTTGKTLRKQVNALHGFPPSHKPEKERFTEILFQIAGSRELTEAIAQIDSLPHVEMTEQQWQTLESLLYLLPVAAAHLRLLFKNRNQADFTEIAQRAELALGEEDNPTDLALVMDHQLSHLLMDEVQDTSRAQIALLRKLTAGWQDGDGRTMFFVGDPMQSIYRFREADVANFRDIQQHGIGDVQPESLQLESNFRSSQNLIDWFNQAFPDIFSTVQDSLTGGVEYAPGVAVHPATADNAVEIHRLYQQHTGGKIEILEQQETDTTDQQVENNLEQNTGSKIESPGQQEADLIRRQVENTLAETPQATIGILGRTRNHLLDIAQALRLHGIPYQAVELESLHERTPIQDLLALTRALNQLGDRIAWLAVLRAPWCGLDLKDLSVIALDEHSPVILQACTEDRIVATMSTDGQQRIRHFLAAIQPMIARHGRVSLRHNVEAAWLRLGGPACVESVDLADCEVWLDLLDTLETEHTLITPAILTQATEQLWSKTDVSSQVQLLTMHKSKGLEFDVVMLPQLHRRGPHQDNQLLRWIRLPDQFLMAGLPDAKDPDSLYQYIGALEEKQRANDNRRLLYVACTRARRKLHLYVYCVRDAKAQAKSPTKGSLLHLLWPPVQREISKIITKEIMEGEPTGDKTGKNKPIKDEITEGGAAGDQTSKGETTEDDVATPDESTESRPSGLLLTRFRRLPLAWSVPDYPRNPGPETTTDTDIAVMESKTRSSSAETQRIIGIAFHQILEHIDVRTWARWKQEKTDDLVDQGRIILIEHGLYSHDLESACASMRIAVDNIKSDERAEWIFSPDHDRIKTEWPLTGVIDHAPVNIIIDRTFIDQAGLRWIIDFKLSDYRGSNTADFLEQEKQRYLNQMARYSRIMQNLESNKIMLALYFPLLPEWCEWSA